MRELRIVLLVVALAIGSLEVLIYVLHLPPDASRAAAAALPAPQLLEPSILVPDPICNSMVDGHYAHIGYLQSVPVESPCD